jgi:hypothetical protein
MLEIFLTDQVWIFGKFGDIFDRSRMEKNHQSVYLNVLMLPNA